MADVFPRVGHDVWQSLLNASPAPGAADGEDGQRGETDYDQEELQNLVIDRAGKAAEISVSEDDRAGEDYGTIEIPAEHEVEHLRQSVHGNPGRKERHDGERDGVQAARLLVEPHFEVFGDGARFTSVVERHHEDADEEHGRDRADPVEVRGHDAVLRAGSGHADYLLRAEVGCEEGEAGDPDGNVVAGSKKFARAGDRFTETPADADHKREIQNEDDVVDGRQVHN